MLGPFLVAVISLEVFPSIVVKPAMQARSLADPVAFHLVMFVAIVLVTTAIPVHFVGIICIVAIQEMFNAETVACLLVQCAVVPRCTVTPDKHVLPIPMAARNVALQERLVM